MRFESLIFLCCFIVPQIVGQLKPIEKYDDGYQSFFQIIEDIDKVVHFKNFIIFFGNSASTLFASSPHQKLIEAFERTLIVAGPYTGSLKKTCTDQSLAMVFVTGKLNYTLDVLLKTMDGLKMGVLFVFNMPESDDIVEYIFNWSTKQQYKKVLFAFYRNRQYEIWTFKSRPKFIVFQINILEFNYQFLHKYFNMEGYKSVIGFFHRLPDAFLVSFSSKIEEDRRFSVGS